MEVGKAKDVSVPKHKNIALHPIIQKYTYGHSYYIAHCWAGSNVIRDCLQGAGLQEKQKKFSDFKHDLWDL